MSKLPHLVEGPWARLGQPLDLWEERVAPLGQAVGERRVVSRDRSGDCMPGTDHRPEHDRKCDIEVLEPCDGAGPPPTQFKDLNPLL